MKTAKVDGMSQLHAAYCLPEAGRAQVLSNVAVSWQQGQITQVQAEDAGATAQAAHNTLLMPPLSNAHDHGRGIKSLAYGVPDQPVETWVAATYTLPPVDPYLVAANAFARMARSGIGSVTHCHLSRSPEALLVEAKAARKAAHDVGIRVAFVVPLGDRYRLGYADDEAVLAHMPADVAEQTRQRLGPVASIEKQLDTARQIMALGDALFQVQLGPVSIERCSDALIEQIAALSAETGNRVHMHVLESKYQRQWADHHYPQGVMRHLDALGLLSSRLTIAHGTWLRPDECELLAQRGVIVSVNTSSNLRLRSGVAPVAALQQAGTSFALGLDALALDDDDDMLREMRLARLLHGGEGFDDGVEPQRMLEAVCRIGARAAGVDAGAIQPGAVADLLMLDLETAAADTDGALASMPTLLHARATAAHVHTLVVAGRTVVSDGKLTGVDEAAIQQALTEQLRTYVPDLALSQTQLKAYRAAIEQFYRAGGHCGGC